MVSSHSVRSRVQAQILDNSVAYECTECLAIPLHVGQDHEPSFRVLVFVYDLVCLFLVLENVVHPDRPICKPKKNHGRAAIVW